MKLLHLVIVSLVVAGLLVAISSLPFDIPSLLQMPGDILNLFWEQFLFDLTNDPYYSLGDVRPVLCFFFYFVLSLFVGAFTSLVRASRTNFIEGVK